MSIGLIAIDGEDAGIAMLLGISQAKFAVLILQFVVLISESHIEIVLLAAANGVVKAQRSYPGGAAAIQRLILLAQMILKHIVTQRQLQTICDKGRSVVQTIVVKVPAGGKAPHSEVVTFLGRVQEVVINADFAIASIAVTIIVHGYEPLLALVLVQVNLHMDSARLAALGKGGLGIGTGQV